MIDISHNCLTADEAEAVGRILAKLAPEEGEYICEVLRRKDRKIASLERKLAKVCRNVANAATVIARCHE